MRIIGWILTILGCVWAFSGVMRIIVGFIGPGKNIALGLITLALAALAIWAGGKLRAKAAHAKSLKTIG